LIHQAKLDFSIFSKSVLNQPHHIGLYQIERKNQREANGGEVAGEFEGA
jgi:hypothetical protein